MRSCVRTGILGCPAELRLWGMVCAVNNHTENLEQPVFTFNSGSYTGPLLCSSNYTITEGVAGSSHVTFQSDILDQARVARSACQSLFQLRLSAGLMLIMSKPVQVYLIAYMHRHILVFAWFCVEFGPDTNAPIAPGLSFACAAKLLSRAAHCASRTVALLLQPADSTQGLVMTSWKKATSCYR